jgi:hypothetical protein
MAKVLFQATNFPVFRSTLIGYLYEIARDHEIVLLSEEMDVPTKELLEDKTVFPGLQKIVYFESPFGKHVFAKNQAIHRILKKTVEQWKPDVVVAPSDMWPAEMYLFRLSKKIGAKTIVLQSGFKIAEQKRLVRWSYMSQMARLPSGIPYRVRLAFVKTKKLIGYVVYHWMLPMSVGRAPFWGTTSFVFWHESSGLRDADWSAVFSKRDYDIAVKDGVNPEKLVILGHPFEHTQTREFFEKQLGSIFKEEPFLKTATIMWPSEPTGFDANTFQVISSEYLEKKRLHIVKLIAQKLPGWKIFIKPHPAEIHAARIRDFLGGTAKVVDPKEPAEKYIAKSGVIVGMPLPSTTLFTARKQYPQKTILSLNLWNEFLGDGYKNFDGIEYIDSEKNFIQTLDAIRNNTYKKEYNTAVTFDFPDAGKLIQYVHDKRLH